MSLTDEIHPLVGDQRKFMLFRILGETAEVARCLIDVPRTTYNHWFEEPTFVAINRKRDELAKQYRKEAFLELRKNNRLTAILLEESMLKEMKAEVDSKEYNLIKTPLAREVYANLMNSAEEPTGQGGWAGRLQQIFVNTPLSQAEVVGVPDGRQLQANTSPTTEYTEGELLSEGEQGNSPNQEEVQPQ